MSGRTISEPPRLRCRGALRRLVLIATLAILGAACSASPAGHEAGPRSNVSRSTTIATPAPTTTTTVAPTTTSTAPTTQPSSTEGSLPATTSTTPTTSTLENLKPLFGKVWQQIPTASRVVALTFDAGANGNGVPAILSTLRSAGVPSTFFLTGAFTKSFPDLARSIVQGGYRIGDHTVDHPHLPSLSDAMVAAEVTDAAATITSTTGASPSPLFRFPYGDSDARTLTVVNDLGYVAVGWTVDTLGWEGSSSGITAASIVARVMAGLRPGEIVLMHVGSNPNDGSTLDADALASVIGSIKAAGYSFVTLDALLGNG
jgi:peptidoglycan-N-acetylglucosamine deacetylase